MKVTFLPILMIALGCTQFEGKVYAFGTISGAVNNSSPQTTKEIAQGVRRTTNAVNRRLARQLAFFRRFKDSLPAREGTFKIDQPQVKGEGSYKVNANQIDVDFKMRVDPNAPAGNTSPPGTTKPSAPGSPAPSPGGPGPAPVPSPGGPGPAPVPSPGGPGSAPVPSPGGPGPAPVPSPGGPGPAPVPSPGGPGPAPVPFPGGPGPAPVPSPGGPGPAPVPSQGGPGPAPVPSPGGPGPAPVPSTAAAQAAPMIPVMCLIPCPTAGVCPCVAQTPNSNLPAPAPQPVPGPAPQPAPGPAPQPSPVPAPQPSPVPAPRPSPAPTPTPAPPKPTPAPSFMKDLLQLHNKYRKIHNAPPLTLNDDMSNQASDYAEKIADLGALVPSGYTDRPSNGESLALICNGDSMKAAEQSIKNWYDEVCSYTFGLDGPQKGTQHFTGLVWKGTTQVGIGKAERDEDGKKCFYIVVRYQPSGNIETGNKEYTKNVEKGSFNPSYCSNVTRDEGGLDGGYGFRRWKTFLPDLRRPRRKISLKKNPLLE